MSHKIQKAQVNATRIAADNVARATVRGTIGATVRAAAILRDEDKRVDAAIGLDGIARALDTAFGAVEARADIARNAGASACKVAKQATAAHMTAEIKAREIACHYADNRDVTGALARSMMRVRKGGHSVPSVAPQGFASASVGASQIVEARGTAVRDVCASIATFHRASNGAIKSATRNKIRAILHVWKDDTCVMDAARNAGWRV